MLAVSLFHLWTLVPMATGGAEPDSTKGMSHRFLAAVNALNAAVVILW